MDTLWMVLGGIAGMVLGFAGGLKVGELIRGKAEWTYWSLNAIALILGVGVAFAGLIFGFGWLVGMAIGFEGGVLTGLKYGYGKSVGPWRVVDNALENDRDLQ